MRLAYLGAAMTNAPRMLTSEGVGASHGTLTIYSAPKSVFYLFGSQTGFAPYRMDDRKPSWHPHLAELESSPIVSIHDVE